MDAAEVKKKVDRLAELDRQMVAVKGEMETIKAWFEKQATVISGYEEQNRRILGKRKFQSGGRKQRDRETNLHDNGKEAPGGCLQGLCKRRCFL